MNYGGEPKETALKKCENRAYIQPFISPNWIGWWKVITPDGEYRNRYGDRVFSKEIAERIAEELNINPAPAGESQGRDGDEEQPRQVRLLRERGP